MARSVRILVVKSDTHFFVLNENNSKRSISSAKKQFKEDMKYCGLFDVFRGKDWNVLEYRVSQSPSRRQFFYAKGKLIDMLTSRGLLVV